MTLNPEIQRRAQKELDQAVGRERLPDFHDKGSLPFVEAVYKEVLRWFPIVPLSIPHTVSAEDVYKGLKIPKGTIVFPNVWYVALSISGVIYQLHVLN